MNAVTICGEGGIQNTDLSVAETAFTEEEGSPVVPPKTVDDTPPNSHKDDETGDLDNQKGSEGISHAEAEALSHDTTGHDTADIKNVEFDEGWVNEYLQAHGIFSSLSPS